MTFLKDAIGSEDLLSYEAAVNINYPLIGNAVLKVDDLLAAFNAAAGSNATVSVGDTVCGSDGGEIGEISKLVEAGQDGPGYMAVPRGIIFEKDTYIPLDVIVKHAGSKVFINMPKMVVSKMPWGHPPTTATEQEKFGPQASQVDKLYMSRNPTGPH